jgi:hypothetical protein
MTTEKQIAANQRNAKASTGPTTAAGLANSSMNALKHGLTSEKLVLFDEKSEDHANFHRELMERLLPVGPLEAQLAQRIVFCLWSLRRVYRIEARLFARGDVDDELLMGSGPRDIGAVFRNLTREGSLVQLSRYERTRERALYEALHELERLQAARMGEAAAAPAALDDAEPARLADGYRVAQDRSPRPRERPRNLTFED